MKFCKVLESAAQRYSQKNRVFLRYKLLKKLLSKNGTKTAAGPLTDGVRKELLFGLGADMERLNSYFIEREEVAVIRMSLIQMELATKWASSSTEEKASMLQLLANFHGELVMLLNWSQLNYQAVAKLLKKHDKVTLGSLKETLLNHVLRMPFCSTGVLSRLARLVEKLHKDAFEQYCAEAAHPELNPPSITQRVEHALKTWEFLATSASTPSTIFLPANKKQASLAEPASSCALP